MFASENWNERLRKNLPEWLYKTEWVDGVITVISDQLDFLYVTGIQGVSDSAHLETAIKDAIDRHASKYLLSRQQDETDTELKRRIGLELAILRSSGTVNDIQNLMTDAAWVEAGAEWDDRLILEEDLPEIEPAFFRLSVPAAQIEEVGAQYIRDIIERAKSAGVRFELIASDTFGYVDIDSEPADYEEIEGYGDTEDATVGGKYSGLVL